MLLSRSEIRCLTSQEFSTTSAKKRLQCCWMLKCCRMRVNMRCLAKRSSVPLNSSRCFRLQYLSARLAAVQAGAITEPQMRWWLWGMSCSFFFSRRVFSIILMKCVFCFISPQKYVSRSPQGLFLLLLFLRTATWGLHSLRILPRLEFSLDRDTFAPIHPWENSWIMAVQSYKGFSSPRKWWFCSSTRFVLFSPLGCLTLSSFPVQLY